MDKKEIVGIAGQYCSLVVCSAGLIVEIAMGAHIGFILITAGALIFAVATKIRGK